MVNQAGAIGSPGDSFRGAGKARAGYIAQFQISPVTFYSAFAEVMRLGCKYPIGLGTSTIALYHYGRPQHTIAYIEASRVMGRVSSVGLRV